MSRWGIRRNGKPVTALRDGLVAVILSSTFLCLTWSPVAATAVAAQAISLPKIQVEHDVSYGTADGVNLLMDVYEPARGRPPYPAVVVVHGGGFYTGDKSTEDIVRASQVLAAAGFEAFAINYRLAPEFPFPAANDDVRTAVAFVRQNAARFGVDPRRIALAGASAGSTLAAWVAYLGSGSLTTDSRVSAVVAWSGSMDLPALLNELSPTDQRVNPTSPGHGYLASGPSLSQELRRASPISFVDPSDPPLLYTIGAHEQTPIQQAELMRAKLQQQGVSVTVHVIPGSDHALYGRNFRPDLIAAVFFLGRELHNSIFAGLKISFPPILGYHRLPRILLWGIVLLLLVWTVGALAFGGRSTAAHTRGRR
jgi:acetyl esterase